MSQSNAEPRQVFRAYGHGPGTEASHPRNPFPGVVVLIENAGRVLLVRRGSRRMRGGKWCLPGGFIEYGEDFLSAGLREVREETGLSVRIESILSVVTNFLAPRLHSIVVVLLARPLRGDQEPRAGDDAEALAWHPLSGPLPDMAFEADSHIIGRFHETGFTGAPVDPRFASPAGA